MDSKSIYKEAINSHHKELDELNIFYITESLPYGFIDNKQCLNFHKIPDPNIVFFTNIAPGDFLLKGLKKRGILSIGLSAGYVEGLDYPIYGNNNNGEFALLILSLFLIIREHANKNEKFRRIIMKNNNNEKIKI